MQGHSGGEHTGPTVLLPHPETPLLPARCKGEDSLDPDDRVVEFRVNRFQVFQGWSLVEHPLIEREGEACVNELPMIQSLRKKRHAKGVRSSEDPAQVRLSDAPHQSPTTATCPLSPRAPTTLGPQGQAEPACLGAHCLPSTLTRQLPVLAEICPHSQHSPRRRP